MDIIIVVLIVLKAVLCYNVTLPTELPPATTSEVSTQDVVGLYLS